MQRLSYILVTQLCCACCAKFPYNSSASPALPAIRRDMKRDMRRSIVKNGSLNRSGPVAGVMIRLVVRNHDDL